mmetsp:Transcript_3081/g.7701  ORF Transcript_3081/g.7701 Transcript_3081/m.7701 type:complete len:211 (-) Transcript_3081:11-643(-)
MRCSAGSSSACCLLAATGSCWCAVSRPSVAHSPSQAQRPHPSCFASPPRQARHRAAQESPCRACPGRAIRTSYRCSPRVAPGRAQPAAARPTAARSSRRRRPAGRTRAAPAARTRAAPAAHTRAGPAARTRAARAACTPAARMPAARWGPAAAPSRHSTKAAQVASPSRHRRPDRRPTGPGPAAAAAAPTDSSASQRRRGLQLGSVALVV